MDDSEVARREAAAYETPAMTERRRLVRSLLAPGSSESVLSVGCGPGFEPAELGDEVRPAGTVLGLDRSPTMLDLARERCMGRSSVSLLRGDATRLPVASGAFDAATAVQVYEYVETLDRALSELSRVLVPGGRAVVVDTDYDSLVWHADDRERMAMVLDAWEDYFVRPHLGSQLGPRLRNAGFDVECIEPHAIVNTTLDEDRFVAHFAAFVEAFTADHGDLGPEVADAWMADLRQVERRGGTFFGLTQYCYLVRKPR